MSQPTKQKAAEASKILMILASVVLVVAGAKASADFFVPVLLAFFIATVSFPITNWLREHRVPRSLAVLITVLVDFAFLAGVVLVGIMLIGELQTKWESKYYDLTKVRVTQLADNTSEFMDKWGLLGKKEDESAQVAPSNSLAAPEPSRDLEDDGLFPEMEPAERSEIETLSPETQQVQSLLPEETPFSVGKPAIEVLTDELLKQVSVNKVLTLGTNLLGGLVSFMGTTFVVMFLTVFMLSEARMFGRRFHAICDAKGPNLQRMLSATRDIQRYLGIKTLVSLMTGFLAGVLCWAIGLEFPLLWGILAFGLNYVPAIGSIIAGVPPILLSLLIDGDIKKAAVIAGGYLLINGFLGNFLEPTLLGRRFGISTLVIVISVLFWGWIWGPIGMLLAVPLTMLVKVAMDNSADFRWIAVAISKEDKDRSERSDSQRMHDAVTQASEAEEARKTLSTKTEKLSSEMFPDA